MAANETVAAMTVRRYWTDALLLLPFIDSVLMDVISVICYCRDEIVAGSGSQFPAGYGLGDIGNDRQVQRGGSI